jgi:hypothetical protein
VSGSGGGVASSDAGVLFALGVREGFRGATTLDCVGFWGVCFTDDSTCGSSTGGGGGGVGFSAGGVYPGCAASGLRLSIGMYFLKNLRFLSVTRPEPSMLTMY